MFHQQEWIYNVNSGATNRLQNAAKNNARFTTKLHQWEWNGGKPAHVMQWQKTYSCIPQNSVTPLM